MCQHGIHHTCICDQFSMHSFPELDLRSLFIFAPPPRFPLPGKFTMFPLPPPFVFPPGLYQIPNPLGQTPYPSTLIFVFDFPFSPTINKQTIKFIKNKRRKKVGMHGNQFYFNIHCFPSLECSIATTNISSAQKHKTLNNLVFILGTTKTLL